MDLDQCLGFFVTLYVPAVQDHASQNHSFAHFDLRYRYIKVSL